MMIHRMRKNKSPPIELSTACILECGDIKDHHKVRW